MLEDQLYDFIKQRGKFVTFAELRNAFPDFKGSYAWTASHNPHFIYWNGTNADYLNALQSLLKKKCIKMDASSHLTYLIDGCTLNLPIPKSKKMNRKTDCWIPVAFTALP